MCTHDTQYMNICILKVHVYIHNSTYIPCIYQTYEHTFTHKHTPYIHHTYTMHTHTYATQTYSNILHKYILTYSTHTSHIHIHTPHMHIHIPHIHKYIHFLNECLSVSLCVICAYNTYPYNTTVSFILPSWFHQLSKITVSGQATAPTEESILPTLLFQYYYPVKWVWY